MTKQLTRAILLAWFLSGSGFAQRMEVLGKARIEQRFLNFDAVEHNLALVEDYGSVWKNAGGQPENNCSDVKLLDLASHGKDGRQFHEVPIWQLPDSQAFYFVSGMTIDADGAPNAYNPDDTGLDALANAGTPAHWDGIITDRDGNPFIQRETDPFPGYYISCTSLADETKEFTDPTRYVDASKIPYVVLPQDVAERGGARLGDLGMVTNLRNGKWSFAIYADIGTLGEGSVALADALGIHSDARRGGAPEGILFLLFPGSGNRQPRTLSEIQSEGERLMRHWGIAELSNCPGK